MTKALYIEVDATSNALADVTMTDGRTGKVTGQKIWSNLSGKSPKIVPVGLLSGGRITPAASGANNKVDVAAFTYYDELQVKRSVSAQTDVTITRASNGTHRINSITVAAVAGTVAAVAGEDAVGASAFSENRGVDGGPPWIPYGTYQIELGQVATASATAAPITPDEILQIRNQHTEASGYPVFDIYPIGDRENDAYIKFSTDLPEIHSDDDGVTKYRKLTTAKTYEPTMNIINFATDFVPSETSLSPSEETRYAGQRARGEPAASTSAVSFTTNPTKNDTVSDYIKFNLSDAGEIVTLEYYPDEDNPGIKRIEQGYLSGTSTNPAEGLASISFTLAPSTQGVSRSE